MFKRQYKERYVRNFMKNDGVNKSTIDYFIHFERLMKVSYPFTTTTNNLAEVYEKSSRQIRRYIQTLREKGYLLKKKNMDYSNPDKPVHVNTTFTWTTKAKEMLEVAENEHIKEDKKREHVFFIKDKNETI